MRRITDKEILGRGYTAVAENCALQDLERDIGRIQRNYRTTQIVVLGIPIRGSIHGALTIYIPTRKYEDARPQNPRLAEKVHLRVRGNTQVVREAGERLVKAITAKPKSDVLIGGRKD